MKVRLQIEDRNEHIRIEQVFNTFLSGSGMNIWKDEDYPYCMELVLTKPTIGIGGGQIRSNECADQCEICEKFDLKVDSKTIDCKDDLLALLESNKLGLL